MQFTYKMGVNKIDIEEAKERKREKEE